MSDSSIPQRAPGFFWLLVVLAGLFAVVTLLPSRVAIDTRADTRTDNRAAIGAIHTPNLEKMGLVKGKSADALAKGLAMIKTQPAKVSTVAVPGSPTQLKQAAAAAPGTPAAVAPAPAPAK